MGSIWVKCDILHCTLEVYTSHLYMILPDKNDDILLMIDLVQTGEKPNKICDLSRIKILAS